jgi:hypothetical protein
MALQVSINIGNLPLFLPDRENQNTGQIPDESFRAHYQSAASAILDTIHSLPGRTK